MLLLDDALVRVATGKLPGLIVLMPPQNGKSTFCSQYFVSWFLGTFPDLRVILSSYSAELANRNSRKARDLLEAFGSWFNVSVSKKSSAANRWDLANREGGVLAAGVGGGITGHGGDVGIIDDPFKDYSEAFSALYRDKVWDWYLSTFLTRLHKNAPQIIIMTRWHHDDLVGRILKEAKPGEWEVISLPALAESEDDALGRKIGEPLCPELYPKDVLLKRKEKSSEYIWGALYQQRPSKEGGNIIKDSWWRYYDPSNFAPPKYQIMSWDLTFKGKKNSDYVVGQVWGGAGPHRYLLDQVRARMDFVKTIEAFKAMTAKWPGAHIKLIEDKANGPAVISTLADKIEGLIPIEPRGGKEARLASISWMIEAGNVWLPHPETTPWVKDLVDEISAFPTSPNADQVDATSQALYYMKGDNDTSPGDENEFSPPMVSVTELNAFGVSTGVGVEIDEDEFVVESINSGGGAPW